MAARHGHYAVLWGKLYELELQLAAYKLLRGEEVEEDVGASESAGAAADSYSRGRQYDAYMRRRDERRVASATAKAKDQQSTGRPSRGTTRAGGGTTSPLTSKCAARDAQQQVRRASGVSIPTTPRMEHGTLPRSRTVSGGSAPLRPQHHRRNSVAGILADFGDNSTPRPFLRRGSGTGGASTRLRTPRVHDLLQSDVPCSSPRRPPAQDHSGQLVPARHLRSVSELPFHVTVAAMGSPIPVETPPTSARARKRWGSPETPPPAMFSSASTNPHMDLAKGFRKLLSFVRKSKSTDYQHGQARSGGSGGERDSGGKPVKEWGAVTACSVLDGPFDRASLGGHQFPMTRAVGTSG